MPTKTKTDKIPITDKILSFLYAIGSGIILVFVFVRIVLIELLKNDKN